MTFLSGPRTAPTGTAKSPDLGLAHLFMGVMDVSLGTAVMGGTPGSLDQVATLVTLITGTVAQRAETRTSEVTHGILLTGD